MTVVSDLIALIAEATPDELGRGTPNGNLTIWLSFIGVMFTAGVGVIVAVINRGQKELHGDHANVQVILGDIKANQENFSEDIGNIRSSIIKVHERLDRHMEHHNEVQTDHRQRVRLVADNPRD